jgi:hypothetical protein
MKLTTVVAIAAVVAMLTGASAGKSSTAPSASVENIATVIIGFVTTNFEFRLYNCPAGEEMTVVDWQAEQPARPGNGAEAALAPFGPSTGEQVQYLTLTAGSNFIAGERWVGSGTVACGAVLIPVSGSGQTVSQTGV